MFSYSDAYFINQPRVQVQEGDRLDDAYPQRSNVMRSAPAVLPLVECDNLLPLDLGSLRCSGLALPTFTPGGNFLEMPTKRYGEMAQDEDLAPMAQDEDLAPPTKGGPTQTPGFTLGASHIELPIPSLSSPRFSSDSQTPKGPSQTTAGCNPESRTDVSSVRSDSEGLIKPRKMMGNPVRGHTIMMESSATSQDVWNTLESLLVLFSVTVTKTKQHKGLFQGTYAIGYDVCSFEAQIWQIGEERSEGGQIALEFRNKRRSGRVALMDITQKVAFAMKERGVAREMSHGDQIYAPLSVLMEEVFGECVDGEPSTTPGGLEMPPPLGVMGLPTKSESGILIGPNDDDLVEDWSKRLAGNNADLPDQLGVIAKSSELNCNAQALAKSSDFVRQIVDILDRDSRLRASSLELQISYSCLRLLDNLAACALPGSMDGLGEVGDPRGLDSLLHLATSAGSLNWCIQATALRTLGTLVPLLRGAAAKTHRGRILDHLRGEVFAEPKCKLEYHRMVRALA